MPRAMSITCTHTHTPISIQSLVFKQEPILPRPLHRYPIHAPTNIFLSLLLYLGVVLHCRLYKKHKMKSYLKQSPSPSQSIAFVCSNAFLSTMCTKSKNGKSCLLFKLIMEAVMAGITLLSRCKWRRVGNLKCCAYFKVRSNSICHRGFKLPPRRRENLKDFCLLGDFQCRCVLICYGF